MRTRAKVTKDLRSREKVGAHLVAAMVIAALHV